MRLAIMSIDRNTLVDASKRFQLAEKEANAHHNEQLDPAAWSDLYWRTAFRPDLVQHDALVPDALEQVGELKEQEYTVLLLASRPESMRAATETWLGEHGVPYDFLVLKHPAFQYTKSLTWQAGTVHELALMFRASEVLYFDADVANRVEVGRYSGPYVLRVYDRLAASPEEQEDADLDEPF
jgi:hypothetical protein